MGTNYYLHLDVCKHCGRSGEVLHIGKSSAGWRFMFHFIEGRAESVSQWLHLTRRGVIKTEYKNSVSFKDFWLLVKRKQKLKSSKGYFDVHPHESFVVIDGFDFSKGEFS